MIEKTIYYHDTDAGGVVYYGRYLNFLEEARTEFLADQGVNVKKEIEKGFTYAVVDAHIQYKSPARYGDVIECSASVDEITASKLVFKQSITNVKTQKILVEARIILVCLDSGFKPIKIPQDVRNHLQ